MQERHKNRKLYFHELAQTSQKYFIPYIKQFKQLGQDSRILEIGCGDGGNLLPFAQMGYYTLGVDISERRIADAQKFFTDCNAKGDFLASDVFLLEELYGTFDVIICHDVIEHIGEKKRFLSLLPQFLAKNGIVFMSFPAWQMPFGGHQQTCVRKGVRVLPWIHLLPMPVYRGILRLFKESEQHIEELMDIRRSRMTVETFESLCRMAGYVVLERTLWFVNPHYKAKFGLHPMKLRLGLDRIPYLRNWLSTSCWYVIH